MARRSPIDILLTTRITALATAVPAALGGEAVAVHQARVASRRLREMVPVLESAAPSAAPASTAVRRVTRALGPVRELDVTAGLYAEITAATPVHPLAHTAVGRALARSRAAAMRAAREALSPAHLARLRTRLDTLAAEADGLQVTAVAAAVDARLAGRGRRLARALDRLGVVYAAERLHAVRIAVKQLRYALEIAANLRRVPTATSLRQLRAVQEMLGRAHDLHVLSEHLRRVDGQIVTRSRPASRDLKRIERRVDDECRQLHASFLGRRAALMVLASALTAAPRPVRRRRTAA